MGCTSSAPNMFDVHSHTTENEKIEGNDVKNDDLNKLDKNEKEYSDQAESTNVECNESKMLPTCDTLDQNLQLDRKSNSSPDIVTNEPERDMADLNDTVDNVIMEIEKMIPSIELEDPQKFTTFKEVVDQVVSDNILDNGTDAPVVKENDLQNEDKTTEDVEIQDNPDEIKDASYSDELEEINDEEENLGETGSPSQSECSRATRWEALADIAAELPPSLAVDPLTGQIFSLNK